MIFFFIPAIIFLLIMSAFFSASETSLFSISPYTLSLFKSSSDNRRKLIAHLMDNPRELLVTIMMLNILINILLQNTVSSLFGENSTWLLRVGVPLVLSLFFGEIIPKSVALPYNEAVARKVAPTVAFLARILGPLRKAVVKFTSFISRILFFFMRKEGPLSEEELEHLIKFSKDRKVLDKDEYRLIRGYLNLKNSTIKEHMRPRGEILFYDINTPLDRLIFLFVDRKCSRVPVCDKVLDNLLGVISLRRFFFYQDQIKNGELLKLFLKNPLFLPESTSAWNGFHKLKKENERTAIVVNEYGSISGLVTDEDLMEQVIGKVVDERDGERRYARCSSDVIIASGQLELDELENIFGIEIKSEFNAVTLGGWLIEKMECIPQAGQKYVNDDFLFYILAADANRVKKVYVRSLLGKEKNGK